MSNSHHESTDYSEIQSLLLDSIEHEQLSPYSMRVEISHCYESGQIDALERDRLMALTRLSENQV